ncbi:sperm-associated antigen 16 protein [Podargus strigoides]
MEEAAAAGSEASSCLQSILLPQEYFGLPPPKRAAGGYGAPRGPAGPCPQGASPLCACPPRRGGPRGCPGGRLRGSGSLQPGLCRRLLGGSRDRAVPAGDPPAAKLFHRVMAGGSRKTPPPCWCFLWDSSHESAVSDLTKAAEVTVTDNSKDDYQNEEVPADDEFSLQEDDEDLLKALQAVQEQTEGVQTLLLSVSAYGCREEKGELILVRLAKRSGDGDEVLSVSPLHASSQKAVQSVLTSETSVSEIPESMDDFFCNFLARLGMSRTLDCFQTEWYELIHRGVFAAKDTGLVPAVYTCSQQLEAENEHLRKELENYKLAVNKVKEAFLKMQKERDFHRMHYKRVIQEKNKLICDMKRLQAHYASYEPMLKQLTEKYQTILRQRMLTSLERDRAVQQAAGLQATLQNLHCGRKIRIPETKVGHECQRNFKVLEGPTQKALQEARRQRILDAESSSVKDAKKTGKRNPKDSEFPVATQVNPYLVPAKEYTPPLQSGEYKLSDVLQVHDSAVSCLALHPWKDIVVTGSDDHLWKTWVLPGGNIIMKGEGHTDWLLDCCFHPSDTQLVTSSGDTTVWIWDFSKHGCILTSEGDAQAVWDCSWHSYSDFVASTSMNNTGKIWDVNNERCRCTMCGHKASVNSIEFLPFSNTVPTSSADKTLSLWDARTSNT